MKMALHKFNVLLKVLVVAARRKKVAVQKRYLLLLVIKPGDRIELGLSETTLLNGVMWIYGVPLLVLILSAIIFSTVFKNELAVASCMLISTACAFWGVKKRINHKQQANLMPVFLGKVS